MNVRQKLLLLVYLPVLIATILAVVVSSLEIKKQGIAGLKDKSSSILELNIQEYSLHHQDGTSILEKENKDGENQDSNYRFRISSLDPENPEHQATDRDIQFIERFQKDKGQLLTWEDPQTDSLWVMSPVFMDKKKGCMECHAVTKKGRKTSEDELRGIFIVTSSMKTTKAQVKAAIFEISIVGIITTALAIIIGIAVVMKLVNAIKKINQISKQVAEGDLRQKVNINTGDELEELGNHINEMVNALNRMIILVKEAASGLTQSTHEIATATEKISQGAQEQANQFEELEKSFQFTSQSMIKANEIMGESMSEARGAEMGMTRTIESMVRIQESSQKIIDAVQIINSISFQTNILALNAGVEASHAGIHGRGFSVISSEVKKLSDITHQSSGQINNITNNNQQYVQHGMTIAQEAGETIHKIIQAVMNIVGLLQNMSNANEEQSTIMERNREITKTNASSAQLLSSSAGVLDMQANKLLETVKYFRLQENYPAQ